MPIPHSPRRGELYWLDWSPARGSEQAGRRPGLIVSNDIGNQTSSTIMVVAVTSRPDRRPYPFHVQVPAAPTTGLQRESIVLCEQIMTTTKDRLDAYIGSLPENLMAQVDAALKVALGLR